MDEIENLLDSMRIAIQNEKFYQSENYLAMQEQIKSLEEKNSRLLMDNERLMEEKNLHQKQFIDCHKRLNASNECIKLNASKVKELEKELVEELEFSLDHINDLNDTINDLITCQICYQQFQSNGERIPCKLKCPHIMCKKCAKGWITTRGFRQAQCPTCKVVYTQNDISPINLNYDL